MLGFVLTLENQRRVGAFILLSRAIAKDENPALQDLDVRTLTGRKLNPPKLVVRSSDYSIAQYPQHFNLSGVVFFLQTVYVEAAVFPARPVQLVWENSLGGVSGLFESRAG